ncbi:pyridine nucleotide-disulfide oxidoreductase [Seongchinamella sediminis]|uniref:Pyridine nucleotide-disulfide oxidoreductase n=1 Tax=Seongchinamella sediminis TaxID=2283635 RepID=A0A3L7DTQ6_9GAMM|nr:FAD-dependent oxidoreductase [Seongchinamella sediminis]RLQ20977.1 pyridine nucleotide-disulfide oxidoreductase [Seongchinamella sediminis]
MNKKQLLIVSVIGLALLAWFALDLGQYLQLAVVQERMDELRSWYQRNPLLAGAAYFAVYVAVTGLSVPGAAVMTLAGGALFGFWYALLLVSFGSTVGATLAFLVSRTLLRDWVQGRFGRQLKAINSGFARDGSFYLFTLRLVPLFPFFVINLLMGLLPIGVWRYYWVSQLGMLPATAVYVNAGTQLGQLESLAGIVSPGLLGSFVLLGLFPLLARFLVGWLAARRKLAGWDRPDSFDSNLIVIGAGSAGLVSALIAATVKAKVTLVERDTMGGDCLNTGCVPSKALIRSARMARYAGRAEEFGLAPMTVNVRFGAVMQRVQRVIKTIEPHDSVERFTSLGVDCLQGEARIVSPWEVEVDGRRISAPRIVLASGARPRMPDIPGLDGVDYLTSDSVWQLQQLPSRLLVLGAGPIGCELAQAFCALGSEVTLVTHAERIMPREDPEVSAHVQAAFVAEGMQVICAAEPLAFHATPENSCVVSVGGEQRSLGFDRVLLAVGRTANVDNMGLESVGVACNPQGQVVVDDYLRTAMPTIFAAGDVAGPYQFTHMASHQAWYATVNALFGRFRRFRVDYSVVPWATFTDPEVGRVGLNEKEAAERGIACEVSRYDISDLDRAIADGEAGGFVKVLTAPGSDRILGATIVGYHAGELINEFVMAMKHGLGLNKILATIHIYPTLGESNKFLAGEWRKARKPEKLLALVERYHRMVRG